MQSVEICLILDGKGRRMSLGVSLARLAFYTAISVVKFISIIIWIERPGSRSVNFSL